MPPKGFTLIELMIVIAIIAILAAIIVPSFVRSRQRAQLTACEENEKSLATALEMYAADNEGLYPTALGKLTPNYLNKLPSCPAGRNATTGVQYYNYRYRANPNGYIVYCAANNHRNMKLQPGCPCYSPFIGGITENTNYNDILNKYF